MQPLQSTFSPLSHRGFRLLWLGAVSVYVAFFTSAIVQQVAAYELAHDNGAPGWVSFGRGLAQLALGPLGGALADRWVKRTILQSCQWINILVFASLGALTSLGALDLWQLTLGAFLIGVSFAFEGPARSAYAIELVPDGSTGRALALNTVALNGARIVGPALSGVLLASPLVGAAGAFYLMAALNALGWLLRRRLPISDAQPDEGSRDSVLSEIGQGLRYVGSQPQLRATVLMFLLVVLIGFPHITLLTGYAEHQLGLPGSSTSWLYGASALGGLFASVVATSYADGALALLLFRVCGALFGASLILSALCTDLISACVVFFVSGVTSGAFMTLYGAALLRATEPRYLGRVMSLGTLGVGAYGLLGLPIGLAADWLSEASILAAMGSAVIAAVAVLSWDMSRRAAPKIENCEEKAVHAVIKPAVERSSHD